MCVDELMETHSAYYITGFENRTVVVTGVGGWHGVEPLNHVFMCGINFPPYYHAWNAFYHSSPMHRQNVCLTRFYLTGLSKAPDHIHQAVAFAKELIEAAASIKMAGGLKISLAIGLHTGSAQVGGVPTVGPCSVCLRVFGM